MITNFKEFEAYSGGNAAIGFRYSDPKGKEENHYQIGYLIQKDDSNFRPQIGTGKVTLQSIASLKMRLEKAIKSVELDYTDLTINPQQQGIYAVMIDFFCYSRKEAETIVENLAYVIDMSGYLIVDVQVGAPDSTTQKAGFKYSKREDDTTVPAGSGAYGDSFPAAGFKYK